MVNSHLVCDPTIPQLGFDLPRQQWSLLNRFRTEQGHWGACRRKWRLTDTDLCPCGETQTMSHIVESCSLTKQNGGLSRLHSADKVAVLWLTTVDDTHTRRRRQTAERHNRRRKRQLSWSWTDTSVNCGGVAKYCCTQLYSDHDWHYWTVTYSIKIWPTVLDLEL